MTTTPNALTLDLVTDASTATTGPFVVRHAQIPGIPGLVVGGTSPSRNDMIETKQSTAVHVRAFMRGRVTGLGYPGYAASLLVYLSKSTDVSFTDITSGVTVTDIGLGWYDILLSASHTDTLGIANLHITGTAVVDNDEVTLNIIAVDKQDTVRMGLTALPNAAAGGLSGVALTTDVTAATAILAADISTSTATVLAAIPSAATVRDAILDAARSGHLTAGSIGEGVALATSLLQGNYYIDNVDNSGSNGPLSQRLRCFVSAAAMAGVTYGGTGQGEFATFVVTTTYDGVNKIHDHKVVQQ